MLRRIYASYIVQRADKPTKRDEYFVLRIGVDADPSGLERSMNLFVLIPKVIGIAVKLVIKFFTHFELKLDLPVDGHRLDHV